MSHAPPQSDTNSAAPAVKETKVLTDARIDAPHVIASEDQQAANEPSEQDGSMLADDAPSVARQLRVQAAQLAEHLRSRQADLDRREAQLNGRVAELENDTRAARLWLAERHAAIEERAEELAKRERQIHHFLDRLATTETAQQRLQQDLAARGAELEESVQIIEAARDEFEQHCQDRDRELDRQREELESRREASLALTHQLNGARQALDERAQALEMIEPSLTERRAAGDDQRQSTLDHREAELRQREAQLAQRERELDRRETQSNEREAELAEGRAELAEARPVQVKRKQQLDEAEQHWQQLQHQTEQLYEALRKDRREFDQQRRRDQQQMVEQQRRAMEELDRKRRDLARRSEQVDRCQASLEQLREEVGQMHRSTLEIRIAAEELWSQLAGAAPPAALTLSLGEIRRRLADDYRDAGAALAEQKQDLVALRLELRQRHEHLAKEKQRLDGWLTRQEQDIQQRAARLVAREQQLDAQETDFRVRAEQWEMDRLAYEHELHRLRGELDTAGV